MALSLTPSRGLFLAGWVVLYLAGAWLLGPADSAPKQLHAYTDRVVAERLAGRAASPDVRYETPLRERGPWRLLLATGSDPWAARSGAAPIAGGLLLLVLCFSMAHRGEVLHGGRELLFAGLLFAASPFWRWVWGDPGDLVGLVLLVAATALHLARMRRFGGDVSIASALLLGAAAMHDLVWLAVWPVLVLHALLVAAGTRPRRTTLPAVLLRGLAGLPWLAVGLLPAVVRNLYALGIPWPPLPGADIMLQAAGAEPGHAVSRLLPLWREALQVTWSGSLARWSGLTWLWIGLAAVRLFRPPRGSRTADAHVNSLALLLIPALPAAAALAVPFTGSAGFHLLPELAGLLLALAAAYTLWDLYWIGPWRRLPVPARTGAAVAAAVLLMGAGVTDLRGRLRSDRELREAARAVRADALAVLGAEGLVVVGADRPFEATDAGIRWVDLTRELSPELFVEPDPRELTGEQRTAYWRRHGIQALLLFDPAWQESFRDAGDLLPLRGEDRDPPAVLLLRVQDS